MDVKNSISKYPETVGVPTFDTTPVEESMNILMEGRIPFELRTTLVKGLHTPESVAEMGERLAGDEKFFLQTFEDSGDLIAEDGEGLTAFTPAETEELLRILRHYVPNAQLRA